MKETRIFIIDDDKLTILVSERILKNFNPGLFVGSFQSGKAALEYFTRDQETQDTIILLDINMPIYNGWDFLEDYSKLSSNCKVFMFTSSIDSRDVEKSKTYQKVKGFISKPLNDEKISRMLEEPMA